MKIAIPLNDAREFSAHYGASSALACFEVNTATRTIQVHSELLPIGSPCSWPDWLKTEGITVMLVGGMGGGAQKRCATLGIEVVAGVPAGDPIELAGRYLAGTLQPGKSSCSHTGDDHQHSHDHQHADSGHCHCSH
ncbi:MAG: NifB/NifX family molybdenum-iron cluster-binding protein [Opitutaceae bacterium]|jgi:predicted Fe-Mo cluster-binding NifX family protein